MRETKRDLWGPTAPTFPYPARFLAVLLVLSCVAPSAISPKADSSLQSGNRRTVRTIRIAGFGALTGPLHAFGMNSRAALQAAAERINRRGGVRLADGATGRFEVSYQDDQCVPATGSAILRSVAASDALVAVGPSCSSVAESLYHALQRTVGDTADSGIRIPVFTDGASKAHLAQISDWAFRNTPNELEMYRYLWAWVRQGDSSLRTVFGGEESDFAHSHSTWRDIIAPQAVDAGFEVVGHASWSLADTAFRDPVAALRASGVDIVVISAHAQTTCGVLREMARQEVRPRLIVGLTSASTGETLTSCGPEADGLLIPTTFVAESPEARAAARAVERAGGAADLHSMAAWEIVSTLAFVIERAGIIGTHEAVALDREKLRAGLARLKITPGLLGTIVRGPDREARKPFVLVQATHGRWRVVARP